MSSITEQSGETPAKPHAGACAGRRASTALAHSSETNPQIGCLEHEGALRRLAQAARKACLRPVADRLAQCGRGVWAWDGRPGWHAPLLDPAGRPVRFLASCNHRLCPRCAPGRMRKLAARIAVLADAEFEGPAAFVTLTREPLAGETPAAVAGALLDAFGRFRRTKVWKSAILGGVAYVHFGGADGRHVHVHAVVDAKWVDQGALLAGWRKCLKPRGSKRAGAEGGAHIERARADENVVHYVLKAQLADKVADADLPGLLAWMQGRRLVQTFGCLHGKRVAEPKAKPAASPGSASGRRSPRGGFNSATGEWIPESAVTWQRSDLAHRVGFGLSRAGRGAAAGRTAQLPDDVEARGARPAPQAVRP